MTRDEFIGKLRSIYVGEENAIDEIMSEYDSMINLNKQLVEECQRLDDEETRLNNIINELEKYLEEFDFTAFICGNYKASKSIELGARLNNDFILDKLKVLKEGNKDE